MLDALTLGLVPQCLSGILELSLFELMGAGLVLKTLGAAFSLCLKLVSESLGCTLERQSLRLRVAFLFLIFLLFCSPQQDCDRAS